MNETDSFDFNDAILEIAKTQETIAHLEKTISPYLLQLSTLKDKFKKQESYIRKQAEAYFAATGDKKPHEAVWITRPMKRQFTLEGCINELAENPKYAMIDPSRYDEAIHILMQLSADMIVPNLELIEKDFRTGASPFEYTEYEKPTVNLSKKLGEYLVSNQEEESDF